MTEEPLIYTTRGNVPVASLAYSAEWRVTDAIAHFTEIYRDATGEIVRQDSHVYAFGADATSEASPTE
jgi:hypothetical protein